MAHGWDSCRQNIPPLSTLRSADESHASVVQHKENFIGRHDFSVTDGSEEAPVTISSFDRSASIENPRTDCAYEKYSGEKKPDVLEMDHFQRRGSKHDITICATNTLQTSQSFNSSFVPHFPHLKQDCEILSTSCLRNCTAVSGCLDASGIEAKPESKFIGLDSFPKQKHEIPSKGRSLEYFESPEGTFQTDTLCSNISKADLFTDKQHGGQDLFPNSPKEVTTKKLILQERDSYDGYQHLEEETSAMEKNAGETTNRSNVLDENLTAKKNVQEPVESEEKEETASTAVKKRLDLSKDDEIRKDCGEYVLNSFNDQDKIASKNVEDTNHLIEEKEQSSPLDYISTEENSVPADYQHRSSASLAFYQSSSRIVDQKSSNSTLTESILPKHPNKDLPIEHSCKVPIEINDQQSNISKDINISQQVKKNFEILPDMENAIFSSDPYFQSVQEITNDCKENLEQENKACAGDLKFCSEMLSSAIVENVKSDEEFTSPSKLTNPSQAPDQILSSVGNKKMITNSSDESNQGAAVGQCLTLKTSFPSSEKDPSKEVTKLPQKMSPSLSTDCSQSVAIDSIPDIAKDNSKSLKDHSDFLSNSKDLEMDTDPCEEGSQEKETPSKCPNENGGFAADKDRNASNDSIGHSDSSSPDSHICLTEEFESPHEITTASYTDAECLTQSVMTDTKKKVFSGLRSFLEPNAQSTDINLCIVKDSSSQGEDTNLNPSSDQQQPVDNLKASEQFSFTKDVYETTRESFKDFDFPTEAYSENDMLFGEPLSGDSNESDYNLSAQYNEMSVTGMDKNPMDVLDEPEPQLTSFLNMRKLLHPVVILKSLESMAKTDGYYHCAECLYKTLNSDHLVEHHYSCHQMPSFQFCQTCNLYLIKHELGKKHLCGMPKSSPPSSSNYMPLKKRLKRGHKCTKCGLVFSKYIHYVSHERKHTGKTPYRCNNCGLYYAQAGSLQRHISVPGRCKRSVLRLTAKETKLPKKEMKRNVSHESMKNCFVKLFDCSKTHLCYFCSKPFKSLLKVKKHMYSVHKKKKNTAVLDQPKDVIQKKIQRTESDTDLRYKCPLCPRIFKYSYNRNRHLRFCVREAIYGGKKKNGDMYVCPLCKTTFTSTSSRYRHIKMTCLRERIERLAREAARLRLKIEKKKAEMSQAKEVEQQKQSKEISLKKQTTPTNKAYTCKCSYCPAVFSYPSGKYRHMKKSCPFSKTSTKLSKFRKSYVPNTPKQDAMTNTQSQESVSHEKTEGGPDPSPTCRFCGKRFEQIELLKKHEHSHRGEKPYRCLECMKGFKKHCHLISHKRTHQMKQQCTICKKFLSNIGALIAHKKTHFEKGMIECSICKAQFQYPSFLKKHMKTHKSEKNPQHDVSEEVPTQSLVSTENQSESKQIQCSLCKESFEDASILRKHCLTHISDSTLNQCPFCNTCFPNRRFLLRHMVKHTGDKPLSCTNCGKQFYRATYLTIHLEKCMPHLGISTLSGPKSYGCSICPRLFKKKDHMHKHLESHRRKTLIPCLKCGQYFGIYKMNIHDSMCIETPELPPADKPIIGNDTESSNQKTENIQKTSSYSNVKPIYHFHCSYCTEKFRFRSIYLRHLVKHTGMQPYPCMHCGQRFKSQILCCSHEAFCDGAPNTVQSEEQTNSEITLDPPGEIVQASAPDGNLQLKCKFCTKTFLKPRHLRLHILTHNEVKPYRCKACDSCFSRHDHLKVHQVHCKGNKIRLEVRIPKICLSDIGKGWQNNAYINPPCIQEKFDCKVCLKSFSTMSKLSRHNTMYHSVKKFKCVTCGSSFSHEKTLKAHKRMRKCRKQNVAKPSVKANATTDSVKQPLESIKNRLLLGMQPIMIKKYKFACTFCPRSFKKSWQLNVHIRLHTGEKPYSCEYCGERFIRRDYVVRHHPKCNNKLQHMKTLCDLCGGFFLKGQLENHKRSCVRRVVSSADQSTFQELSEKVLCDRCGGFFTGVQLEKHKVGCFLKPVSPAVSKTVQPTSKTPPKGFSCAYCSSRFLLFSQLQEHFLSTHKTETVIPPLSTAPLQQLLSDIPVVKEEPADVSCEDLGRDGVIVKSSPDAAVQMDILEQFVCQICNMCFTNKAGLIGHQRAHATVQAFICKWCSKGFWNKAQLRGHYKKCKSKKLQSDIPLKGGINFPIIDSGDDETTAKEDFQTRFCKQEFDEFSQSSSEKSKNVKQSSSGSEKKVVQYQCSECDKSFTDGLLLISHLEDHGREEQEKKRNKCPTCGRIYSNPGNLNKHMKLHETSQSYFCAYCPKVFYKKSDLEKHKTTHETDKPNKPYTCKLCPEGFWTRPNLIEHYSSNHADEIYSCRFCSKLYAVKKSLGRHYKKYHAKELKDLKSAGFEKPNSDQQSSSHSTIGEIDDDSDSDSESDSAPYFPCHVCGKTFTTSESLEDHQLFHLGKKPHECAECGKCFVQASQLQQHQRMHKEEFQCQTCGRGFLTLFALKTHKHTHGKNRPYRCTKCDIGFKSSTELAEHWSIHREESFPCDICNKVFLSQENRREHRKIHSKPEDDSTRVARGLQEHSEKSFGNLTEFKYRCGICSERFKDPEELSEHGCLDAKERPYACTECKKHFLHASHLKKHMETHHLSWSNLEYPCNQCNRSFSSPQLFHNHLKSHVNTAKGIKHDREFSAGLICPICHQCFATARELIHHFPTHPNCIPEKETKLLVSEPAEHKIFPSTSSVEYNCTKCDGVFMEINAFNQHVCFKQQLTSVEELSPQMIASSDHEAEGLDEEEVDVTGEDLYKCPKCSLQFHSKSALLEHQNIEHQSGRLFKCGHCEKTFAKMRYLRKHEGRHRLKDSYQAETKHFEKRFKCTQCGFKCNKGRDLSSHMRLHAENEAGEYRCDMCYKSFSKRVLLRQHQESHVGEVVYECNDCDKAFAFPHLLEEHQQTHAKSFD